MSNEILNLRENGVTEWAVVKGRGATLQPGLLIAALAVLVYANSMMNGFVWDDATVIFKNPLLRGSAQALFTGVDAPRENEITPYYRPLTLLTFLIEERLHGLNPLFMHLFNILLHAMNAFLVYMMTRSVVGNDRTALLAGLLFAVHPLNTEGVNFLAGGRNTMLAGVFVLITYIFHRRSILENKVAFAYIGAGVFFAGLLTKEIALAVLPIIVAMEYFSYGAVNPTINSRSMRRLALYAVSTIVYFVLRSNALSHAGERIMHSYILPENGSAGGALSGLPGRLLNNIYIIPRYLLAVIWPPSLSLRYFIPDDLHLLALPLTVAWIGILLAVGWLCTRGKSHGTLFGLFWMIMFWLPVSGVISFPSAPLADRYLYIPAMGFWMITADLVVRNFPSREKWRLLSTILAVICLVLLAFQAVARNRDWRSDVTLFSRYVEREPMQAFGHHNLGCAYLDQVGDLDSAEREFGIALSLDPAFPRLRTQMGYVRLLRGDYEGAIRHYDEAVAQNPFDAEALLNRGIALDRLGRYNDAVVDYRRFLATPWNELSRARPYAEDRIRALDE